MALASQVTLWSSKLGDVPLNAAQAAAIGAQFGNGAAQFGTNPANPLLMGDDGNLIVQIVSAGLSPGATGADKILALATIPPNGFDIANRGIAILVAGNAPNNNTKTAKVILNPTAPVLGATVSGGTTIANLTATGAGSTGGWQLQANLFKYGLTGSNTQIALHEAGQAGSILGTLSSPSLTTLAENAAIVVAVTGNATTTATDIVFNFLQIFAMN